MVSAIEHYSYCPRQCGLIHLESIFDENLLTLRGHRAHERVDQPVERTERGVRVLRGLPIWSERYGLIGKADAVELTTSACEDASFAGEGGVTGVEIVPIEYKVGKNTGNDHALYQACAQALCLEEMFAENVNEAAVYYVASRQRETYPLTTEVREATKEVIALIRDMMISMKLPVPVADRRCRSCSLNDACMPFAIRSASQEIENHIFIPLSEEEIP